jgi:hypothetical protein
MWCPKNKGLKPNTLGPHGPIRRSPNGPMKRRKQMNKRERKRKREGDDRPEGRKERKRENGALALCSYFYTGHGAFCVYISPFI